MKITPSNIVRALCIGFLVGIGILSWSLNLEREVQWIWLLALIFIILNVAWRVRKVEAVLALIAICGCIFGSVKYMQSFPTELSVANFAGQETIVEGEVRDVEINNGWQRIVISDLEIEGVLFKDRVQIITLPYPEFEYGDLVRARCNLEEPGMIEGFAYDRYLASKSIYATCFTYSVIYLKEAEASWRSKLLHSRSRFIDQLDRVFGEPQGSLLVGLLLGEQRFTDKWKELFLQTGTTHIVAASGYNISVVLWITMGFFSVAGIKRQRAFAFLIAAVVGYILLAGADAAVFRAGVMGIVLIVAHQTGRRTSMVNILLITASVMLVINPRLLRDDVGFQLSMMSTIGLIYLSPIIEKRLKWLPKQLVIRESVIATLAATFASLPVILLQFGEFSLVSLFTNVFVLPWIPIAMASGLIAVLVGFVSIELAAVISALAWLALTVMLWTVEVFASLNLFAQSIPLALTTGVVIVWFIIIYKIWSSRNRELLAL